MSLIVTQSTYMLPEATAVVSSCGLARYNEISTCICSVQFSQIECIYLEDEMVDPPFWSSLVYTTRGHVKLLPEAQSKRSGSNLCFVCTYRFNSRANIKHIRNFVLPWLVYINYSLIPSAGSGAAFDAFWYWNDIPSGLCTIAPKYESSLFFIIISSI